MYHHPHVMVVKITKMPFDFPVVALIVNNKEDAEEEALVVEEDNLEVMDVDVVQTIPLKLEEDVEDPKENLKDPKENLKKIKEDQEEAKKIKEDPDCIRYVLGYNDYTDYQKIILQLVPEKYYMDENNSIIIDSVYSIPIRDKIEKIYKVFNDEKDILNTI